MKIVQSGPHPALANYIAQYLLLSLEDTAELMHLEQIFFPLDLCGLAFFSQKLHIQHPKTGVDHWISTVYTGLVTAACSLTFPQDDRVDGFIVVFTPSGFSELFKMSNADATDYFPDFLAMKSTEGRQLYERMMEAKSVSEKLRIADSYFLRKLPRFDKALQVREACNEIMRRNGKVGIKALATYVNMSLSSFERNFTNKIGVSPKLFARIKRFHNAASSLGPAKQGMLGQIAYESGYYDQAHFIKEFESFTGKLPSSFSLQDFPLFSQLILHRNYYIFKK